MACGRSAPQGTQFAFNGQAHLPARHAGMLHLPAHGLPADRRRAWKRIISVCQAHGLNHIRFHSWCPPEAAFVAADELGFYFQVEMRGVGQPGRNHRRRPAARPVAYAEGDRICNAYGNHPSFLLMAYGNEPAGRDAEFLALWVTYWSKRDPRRLYTSGAGWPRSPRTSFTTPSEPRIQLWGAGLNSRINALPPETAHRLPRLCRQAGCRWSATRSASGASIRTSTRSTSTPACSSPRTSRSSATSSTANHMGDQAHDFLIASGKLQALCYKEEIESALRTPGIRRLPTARPARLPRPGHGVGRRARPVLGRERLCHGGRVPPLLQQHRAAGALDKRYWRTGER